MKTLDIARIVQDAHDFDFWGTRMAQLDVSKSVGEFLDALANARVDFAIVGGIALLAYVEGRNTKDIDLIVALAELQKIPDLQIVYQDRDFARADFRGLQIDILKTENEFFDLIRRQATTQSEIEKRKIKIATPEGLALLKLFALPSLYRQGIFDRVALYETDIAMLMQSWPMERAALLKTLAPFLSETDLDALQDILNDIEKRIRRFRERPSNYLG